MPLDQLLPKSRFARAVALVASGTAASQLIGVAVVPVLTRLFTPDAFGVLAAYVAVLMTLKVVVSLRYEMAIPLAASDPEAVSVLGAALMTMLLFVAACSIAGLALLPWLVAVPQFAPLVPVAWLLPIGLLIAGLYQAFNYWAIRERLYGAIAGTHVAQGFGRSLVQLAAGLLRAGPEGLVAGEIVGQGAGVMRLGRAAWAKVRAHADALRPARIWAAARLHAGFPLLQAPSSALNAAGMQLPALLLAAYYGATVAGLYYVTQRLLAMPVHLLGTAMGQVFLGEVAGLARDDPRALQARFNALSRRLLLLGLAPAGLLVAAAPWGAAWLLGAEWEEAGRYAQWLALSLLLKFSYDGLINLAIVRRHDYAFGWAVLRLALVVGAVTGADALGAGARGAVAALALALAAGYLAKLLLWRHAVSQLVAASPPVAAVS